MYYHFYYEPRAGVSRYGRVESLECDVIEEETLQGEGGYILYKTMTLIWPEAFRKSYWSYFVLGGREGQEKTKTEIHVLKGTIKRGFNLDLE